MPKKKVKSMPAQKTAEPLRVYVEYDRTESGGEAIDPGERWSNRTDRVVEVDFVRLHRESPEHRFFYDSIVINHPDMLKLDKLFLAVVRYSTGDTFGRTTGEFSLVGLAPTYQIAQAMLDEATTPSKQGDYKSYKPWEGFFERLEGTEIHELSLV